MRIQLFAAPLVAASLLLAGCGGDDGPTKAEYVKQADAICQKGGDASQKKLEAAVTKLGAEPTAEQMSDVVSTVLLPDLEGQVKQLRALDTPKSDKDKIGAIYDALDSAIAKGKADPAALLSSDGGASPFDDANAKATAYGLKACGKG